MKVKISSLYSFSTIVLFLQVQLSYLHPVSLPSCSKGLIFHHQTTNFSVNVCHSDDLDFYTNNQTHSEFWKLKHGENTCNTYQISSTSSGVFIKQNSTLLTSLVILNPNKITIKSRSNDTCWRVFENIADSTITKDSNYCDCEKEYEDEHSTGVLVWTTICSIEFLVIVIVVLLVIYVKRKSESREKALEEENISLAK